MKQFAEDALAKVPPWAFAFALLLVAASVGVLQSRKRGRAPWLSLLIKVFVPCALLVFLFSMLGTWGMQREELLRLDEAKNGALTMSILVKDDEDTRYAFDYGNGVSAIVVIRPIPHDWPKHAATAIFWGLIAAVVTVIVRAALQRAGHAGIG